MVTNKLEEDPGGLPGYRAISPDIQVGRIPLDYCAELQAAIAAPVAELSPDMQLDCAWLGLETALAVARGINDLTGKVFAPKEIEYAKQQSQREFRGIVRNEQLPVSIRVAAGLAMASVGMHYEIDRDPPPKAGSKHHISYLRGLQQAAKILLAKEDRTPEDDELLRSMTSIAILTESRIEGAWFLPAPPRQPWSVNAINQRHSRVARMIIANEAPEGTMAISPDALGNELWKSGLPHATLVEYLKVDAGFSQAPIQRRRPQHINVVFDILTAIHGQIMDAHEHALASAALPETQAVVEDGAAQPKRSEIDMYLRSAVDIRDLNPVSLRLQILNAEEAQSKGELTFSQQHVLGWMQLEQARILAMQAQEKRTQAHNLRTQADRVSKFDARQLRVNATEADQAADQLTLTARERFDVAKTTFITTAEAARETHTGESLTMRLDSEAALVYKELFTASDPEAISEAVSAYVCSLVNLAKPMRAAHRALRHNPDQLDILEETALNAAFCLLVTNSSDEASRDLALPTTPRSVGKSGFMYATVFPLDCMRGTYDVDTPVNMQITTDGKVAYQRRYIEVGWDLLKRKGNPLGLLTELETADGGPGQTRPTTRQRRSNAINKNARRIADAIADAIA